VQKIEEKVADVLNHRDANGRESSEDEEDEGKIKS
jgi:hypothetical protein